MAGEKYHFRSQGGSLCVDSLPVRMVTGKMLSSVSRLQEPPGRAESPGWGVRGGRGPGGLLPAGGSALHIQGLQAVSGTGREEYESQGICLWGLTFRTAEGTLQGQYCESKATSCHQRPRIASSRKTKQCVIKGAGLSWESLFRTFLWEFLLWLSSNEPD